MSRHKFVKTLNLNDELEDYDGVANFEDDEGECVRACPRRHRKLPSALAQYKTNATVKLLRQKIKVISWTL